MIVASNVTSVAAGYEFSQFIKINHCRPIAIDAATFMCGFS
jgi:hypothetical protein